jgi:hypothetical protein
MLSPQVRQRKVRKSHLFVMLGSLAAGSAATVTALDSWDKVLVDFGFRKSEASVLADESARGDLVRKMIHQMSQRIFWIARYSGEVEQRFPQAELDAAWTRYNDSVIGWNENYMLNVMLTEKYFGKANRQKLVDIHFLLRTINTCLNKIHYRELYSDPICHFYSGDGGTDNENIAALNKEMAQISKAFEVFTINLSK